MYKNFIIAILFIINLLWLYMFINNSYNHSNLNGPITVADQFKGYLLEEGLYEKGVPLYFVYIDENGCDICLKNEMTNLKNSISSLGDNTFVLYRNSGESELLGLEGYNVLYYDEISELSKNLPVLNPITFVIDQYGFVNHYKYLDPAIDSIYIYNEKYYKFINDYIGSN